MDATQRAQPMVMTAKTTCHEVNIDIIIDFAHSSTVSRVYIYDKRVRRYKSRICWVCDIRSFWRHFVRRRGRCLKNRSELQTLNVRSFQSEKLVNCEVVHPSISPTIVYTGNVIELLEGWRSSPRVSRRSDTSPSDFRTVRFQPCADISQARLSTVLAVYVVCLR